MVHHERQLKKHHDVGKCAFLVDTFGRPRAPDVARHVAREWCYMGLVLNPCSTHQVLKHCCWVCICQCHSLTC